MRQPMPSLLSLESGAQPASFCTMSTGIGAEMADPVKWPFAGFNKRMAEAADGVLIGI